MFLLHQLLFLLLLPLDRYREIGRSAVHGSIKRRGRGFKKLLAAPESWKSASRDVWIKVIAARSAESNFVEKSIIRIVCENS